MSAEHLLYDELYTDFTPGKWLLFSPCSPFYSPVGYTEYREHPTKWGHELAQSKFNTLIQVRYRDMRILEAIVVCDYPDASTFGTQIPSLHFIKIPDDMFHKEFDLDDEGKYWCDLFKLDTYAIIDAKECGFDICFPVSGEYQTYSFSDASSLKQHIIRYAEIHFNPYENFNSKTTSDMRPEVSLRYASEYLFRHERKTLAYMSNAPSVIKDRISGYMSDGLTRGDALLKALNPPPQYIYEEEKVA